MNEIPSGAGGFFLILFAFYLFIVAASPEITLSWPLFWALPILEIVFFVMECIGVFLLNKKKVK